MAMIEAGLGSGQVGQSRSGAALACLILFFLLLSCVKANTNTVIEPPLTDPLAQGSLGFGVISVSFTHVREEPGEEGTSLGYLRKGTLIKILERRAISERGEPAFWLLVEHEGNALEGWLKEEMLEVYNSRSRALTASQLSGNN